MARSGTIPRRSYDEGCVVAHALDLIGDRWALLVVRELMLAPKRFSGLRAGLPGISANVLAQRLDELAAAGLIQRAGPGEGAAGYALTRAGRGLWPVLAALCRWGAGMPGHDPSRFISPTALMLSMRAMVRPDRSRGLPIAAGFRLGGESFAARLGPQGFDPVAGPAQGAILFEGSTNDVAAAVYGPRPLAETLAARPLRFQGDPALGQAFVDGFRLRPGPEAVTPPGPAWSSDGSGFPTI